MEKEKEEVKEESEQVVQEQQPSDCYQESL